MTKKIRKKLLGFEVGMTCYSTLEKDEEDIIIPFVVSLYITSTKIVELLPGYLECLRRDECPKVLGVNLDMMTSTAYWMKVHSGTDPSVFRVGERSSGIEGFSPSSAFVSETFCTFAAGNV